jgi:hypothetical protein
LKFENVKYEINRKFESVKDNTSVKLEKTNMKFENVKEDINKKFENVKDKIGDKMNVLPYVLTTSMFGTMVGTATLLGFVGWGVDVNLKHKDTKENTVGTGRHRVIF